MAKAFSEFGFDDRVMEGIQTMGYETATPVQEQVIPLFWRSRHTGQRPDRYRQNSSISAAPDATIVAGAS